MANTTAQPDAVNAAILGPDILAKQYQLQRAQQYAQLLQQGAMQDAQGPAGEMVSGHYVPTYNGLKSLGKAYLASKKMDELPKMQAENSQAQMAELVKNFGGGGVPSTPAEAASTALAAGSLQGDTGPTLTNADRMNSLTSGTPSAGVLPRLNGMDPKTAAIAYMGMGQGEYLKALASQLSPTDVQKNDRYLGISPDQTRVTELAKRLKEGTQSLLPGQTNVLPGGSRVVAPNFETGVAGGFDANGNPIANEIPGSSLIAANRAGGIKRAEAGVQDAFAVPTRVDSVSGPVALTPAQQRSAANGGIDPARPQSPMTPRSGDSDRAMIYTQEMSKAKQQLASAKTPEEKGRAQADVDSLQREMSRIGIPLQGEGQRATEVDTAKANVVRDTTRIAEGRRYGQMKSTADRALELLGQGPTHSGIGAMVDSAANFFGTSTKGADVASSLGTLSSWMTSNVPRMEGPQSDADVANYRIMAGQVGDKNIPVQQRINAVKELKLLQDKYAELNGGYAKQGGATGGWTGKDQASTNNINALLEKYK